MKENLTITCNKSYPFYAPKKGTKQNRYPFKWMNINDYILVQFNEGYSRYRHAVLANVPRNWAKKISPEKKFKTERIGDSIKITRIS